MTDAASPMDAGSAGEVIDLGGDTSLFVRQAGEGPAIVLVHGALVDHRDWLGEPWRALAPLGRLIAVDRPGHGGSRRPRFKASAHAQAAQIRDAVQRIGGRSVLLVGHSMGAAVALAYAAAYPAEVRGLVLAGPIAFPEFRPMEYLYLAPRAMPMTGPALSQAARMGADAVFWSLTPRIMFSPQRPPPEWLEAFTTRHVTRAEGMIVEGEDAAAFLPGAPSSLIHYEAITAPAIALYGDRDKIVEPRRQAKRLPQALSSCEVRRIDGAGHMVHHASPGQLAQAVADLLGASSG